MMILSNDNILLIRIMIDWHHSLIKWHHSSNTLTFASQIRKESCKKLCYLTCSLYSQRANHMISKKVAKFIELIKRFRNLQEWLKTSDIWRDYQVWNESFSEALSKVQSFDVSRRANAKKISKLKVSELLRSLTLSLLIFLALALEEHQTFIKASKKLLFQTW
jgi:hypothetical protein